MRCKICLRTFRKLKFKSNRISICGRCVTALNTYRSVAEDSYKLFEELLRVGIERRAYNSLTPNAPSWQQERARKTLRNLSQDLSVALPGWLNKMAGDAKRRKKEHKIIRAHRRGLLHYDRPKSWGYPDNWNEIASNIRKADNFTCGLCSATGVEIHVHHIIHTSNFGTHHKENLVSLCKRCHEKVHGRELDFGEEGQVESSHEAITLDKISLLEFIKNDNLVAEIDNEVVNVKGFSITPMKSEIASLYLNYLELFGIDTISDLKKLLIENRELILKRVSDIDTTSKIVPTGICIFYMAQILIAKLNDKEKILYFLERTGFSPETRRKQFAEYLLEFMRKNPNFGVKCSREDTNVKNI